ncbi:hypothetical protein SmJEL517_g01423 [Synchytrium microbalum]|uniref:Polynucleotide 5'-hydroxyl-kinase GRC3 n=1 Tax=Synchytrium microbalum TaxID=1806994 RepID=A0A507C9Y5_9FUNG|nr:uncharacterized protein SmJEL517_g01423 [Synchytrium microbalum]TPX36291.1 hypothetical protein SmJEL517_g01423 [Synchytrium microbalum]
MASIKKRKAGTNEVGIPSSSNPFVVLRTIKKVKTESNGRNTAETSETNVDQPRQNGGGAQQELQQNGFMGIGSWQANGSETALSTFLPTSSTFVTDTSSEIAVLAMRSDETLCFKGSILVCPLRGSISVMGARIHADKQVAQATLQSPYALPSTKLHLHRILSPKTNSLLVIKAESTTSSEAIERKETTWSIDNKTQQRISLLLNKLKPDSDMTVVLVKSCICDAIESLEGCMPQFNNLFTGSESGCYDSGIRGFVPMVGPAAASLSAVKVPNSWTDAVNQVLNGPETQTVCVIGSKHVGKSTFARYLTNSLLNQYAALSYLDADLGQPELSPVAVVSLHTVSNYLLGPPFTHLDSTTSKSVFLGASSPKDEPDAYLDALSELVRERNENDESRTIPCVVNTSGWVKGMGFDLLSHFILTLKPTHIIHVTDDSTPSKNLPADFGQILAQMAGPQLNYTVPAITMIEAVDETVARSRFSAMDFRTLNLQSYFCIPTSMQTTIPTYTHPTCQTPTSASCSSIQIQFVHGSVPPQHTLRALNGTIVGLVIDSSFPKQEATDVDEASKKKLALLKTQTILPARNTHCVGLGLIRAIEQTDTEIILYVITPVRLNMLQKVNLIVRGGGFEAPVSLLVADAGTRLGRVGLGLAPDIPYVMDAGMSDGIV